MTLSSCTIDDGIATITMDDGKANVLSIAMIDSIHAAFDHAERECATSIVLAGRAGRFSGGFDIATLTAGGPDATRMLRGGFELAERLIAQPRPVVVACTGHAIAMGAFLALAGDYRVGARGEFRIHANEVRIGLTMPLPALAILRYRLTPAAFDLAATMGMPFSNNDAVAAGFFNELADPDDVIDTARRVAIDARDIDLPSHIGTKHRARAQLAHDLRHGIDTDFPLET